MNSIIESLRRELKELNVEYDDLCQMSEEAAYDYYNGGTKAENRAFLEAEIARVERELEEAEKAEEYEGWLDPAFRTMADFDRMRV